MLWTVGLSLGCVGDSMCFEALGLQENIAPLSCFSSIRSPSIQRSAFPWEFCHLSNKELNWLCQTGSPVIL